MRINLISIHLPPKNLDRSRIFWYQRFLEAHREKHGIEYRASESNNLVSAIEFSKCNEEHKREIINACKWVQKVTSEKVR